MALASCWTVHAQNACHGQLFAILLAIFVLASGTAIPLTGCVIAAVLANLLLSVTVNLFLLPVDSRFAVLVTGASSGVGRSAALRLARCGFTVFACVRRASDALTLSAEHGNIVTVFCDVTDTDSIQLAVARVASECQARSVFLHALVLCAGSGVFAPVEFVDFAACQRQFAINVSGNVELGNGCLSLMRDSAGPLERRPRLVVVNSGAARVTLAGEAVYGASKRAMLSVTEGWRMELKPDIDVCSIEPGVIATNFHTTAETGYAQKLASVTKRALDAVPGALSLARINHYDRVYQRSAQRWSSAHGDCWMTSDAIELALRKRWISAVIRAGDDVSVLPIIECLPDWIKDTVFGWHYRSTTRTQLVNRGPDVETAAPVTTLARSEVPGGESEGGGEDEEALIQ